MAVDELKPVGLGYDWNKGKVPYKVMSDKSKVECTQREYDDLFIKFSNQAISNYINKFGQ